MKREKIDYFVFIFAVLATTLICNVMALANDDDSDLDEGQQEAVATMLTEPLYQFTGRAFGAINKQEKNVVMSPMSIHKALSMVLFGVDSGSETERELVDVLGLKGLSEDQIKSLHEEYSSIIAKFKKITKESQEFYKSEANKTDDKSRFSRRGQHEHKPPLMDLFNMMITKDSGDPLPTYAEKVKKYYSSSLEKVDDAKPETKCKLLDRLNAWGKEAGFSEPIMKAQELDEKFAAILLSAIHIQGFWFDEFDEHENKKAFHNFGHADKPVKGQALTRSDVDRSKFLEFTSEERAKYKNLHEKLANSSEASTFKALQDLNMRAIEVPLQGGLSFTIFEPLQPSGKGGELAKLTEQLMQSGGGGNKTKLSQVLSLLDSKLGANTVSFMRMPKFHFENELDLKATLQAIGLNKAFNRMSAEIGNMTTNKVFIEKISHQAMIDVNKFGVKAAGVTKIKFALLSAFMRDSPINVQVENPFMFILRYGKLPLFIGQLVKL